MAQSISNRPLFTATWNIPAIILVGMFFFSAFAHANPLVLATDLFEKGEWGLCRRECKRAELQGTEPATRFRLLETLSALHLGADKQAALSTLTDLAEQIPDSQFGAIASYEAGRLQWQFDQPAKALASFNQSFQTTTNKTLFLHAACSIFLLFDEHPELKETRSDLVMQINTSRAEWHGALFKACAKPDPEKSKPQTPNWIIRFYRSQISPAIGRRCVLEPSCSEYYCRAKKKHGLLAAPMVADRFYREPEVSNRKADPVVMPSGQIRYRDPIENHDFWMNK